MDELQPLVWFCTQLQKDIDENLQQKPEQKASSVAAEHEDQVQEVMEKLKAHPQCHVVHFDVVYLRKKIERKEKDVMPEVLVLTLEAVVEVKGRVES